MYFLNYLLWLLISCVSLHSCKTMEIDVNVMEAVDEYLERLYEADRVFWAEGEWYNISEHYQWAELYHAR